MQFIDIKKQYQIHKEEIKEAIDEVLEEGNFIMGHQIPTLEQALADYVGVKHCIAVSSGTDSLVIALMALGIGPGDEVITVPFTFIASVEVIALVGATPVLVDIEPNTYNIDVSQIEAAITPRTKAIIPVSMFGQMPDYAAINAIAEKYNIPVIEDGAQSFGATQNGHKSCSMTAIASTSFFPAKPLGCYGDGGAIFTNDDVLAEQMQMIRMHGGKKRDEYLCLGLNGRLDTIQAAILNVKLRHFPEEVKKRHQIGARYSELLRDCCVTPKVQKGNTHVYSIYTIRTSNRDALANALQEQGIPAPVYYPRCVHQQPVFEHLNATCPEAEKASREVISLPMHPWLDELTQDKIVHAVKEFSLVNT